MDAESGSIIIAIISMIILGIGLWIMKKLENI